MSDLKLGFDWATIIWYINTLQHFIVIYAPAYFFGIIIF